LNDIFTVWKHGTWWAELWCYRNYCIQSRQQQQASM